MSNIFPRNKFLVLSVSCSVCLDMCIDDDTEESDEVRPSGILFLDPRTGDVGTKRYNAMTKRKHLCLEFDGRTSFKCML